MALGKANLSAQEMTGMRKPTSLRQPHEQQKIEKLLVKLAQIKPISARPAPIMSGRGVLKTA